MTNIYNQKLSAAKSRLWTLLKTHRHHLPALALLSLWCLPYVTTGQRIEWGDFSFFAQAYEAIKINVVDYHQFPWWNPWVAGGVPLYANPQMGVFSLQTLLVVLLGAPLGLKVTIALFTFAGYASMYLLLRRYFGTPKVAAIPLSLLWVFCSFFVAHLPSHFTFIWFLIAPLYVYLALTVSSLRGGLYLGLAFAVMAHSQVHNAFFQIGLVCLLIVLGRLVFRATQRRDLLKACGIAALVFLVLAGHRAVMVAQNVRGFPRIVIDPAQPLVNSLLAPILPYSSAHDLFFLSNPQATPYGWGEVTATIGLAGLLSLFFCVSFVAYKSATGGKLGPRRNLFKWLAVAAGFFLLAIGAVWAVSPYALLKHVPVFGEMRISSRWFLWMDLSILISIAISLRSLLPKRSYVRFMALLLLYVGVGEMFLLNVGYQSHTLSHNVIIADRNVKNYQFEQAYHFGESKQLPGGRALAQTDPYMPHFYREYESTTFNMGVIQANDALVDQNTKLGPLCSWYEHCGYVRSANARVVSWSPERVVLQRTAPGHIHINANNSSYFVINGKRNEHLRVAEPQTEFLIKEPDNVKEIVIEVRPPAIP
jgi:hypothetical protein